MKSHKFPIWFYIAIVVNVISWIISWLHIEPFFFFTFIFQVGSWIFILDGISYRISGSSLFSRNPKAFFFLWLLSALFWWYFEIIVMVTKNWYYTSSVEHPKIITIPLATLYFTTVIIGVVELFEIFKKLKWPRDVRIIKLTRYTPLLFFIFGWITVGLTIWRPDLFFPFLWGSLFFILDPINYWLGHESLIRDAMNNDWTRIVRFALASICFFVPWELWNWQNDPKWIYEVPYVGVAKVFEMPILGYTGYLPFGWEIFAFTSFFVGVLRYPVGVLGERVKRRIEVRAGVAYFVGIVLLLGSVLGLFWIEDRVNVGEGIEELCLNCEEVPDFEADSDVHEGDFYPGTVSYCKYSFWDGRCLEAEDGEMYWLVNEEGDKVDMAAGDYLIEGVTVEKRYGMKVMVVEEVYILY